MSDAELRDLRRAWEAGGGADAERALLVALLRHGRINDVLLDLAADCRSLAAREMRGDDPASLNARYYLFKAPSVMALSAVSSALRDRVGRAASDAPLWGVLEDCRDQEPDEREAHAAIRRLLDAPSPEALEDLHRLAAATDLGPRTKRLVQGCFEEGRTGSLVPLELRRGNPGLERGFLAWVHSGPLGRPTVEEVRRQRDGQEISLRLVASPPFVRSLNLLAAWLERAGVGDVFRLDRSAEPLELPGEGPVVARETFGALRRHLGAHSLGFGLLFTERGDSGRWFARHDGDLAVVHVDEFVRERLEAPNLVYAAHMLVKKALDMGLERWERWATVRTPGAPVPGAGSRRTVPLHSDPRGCLFDRCGDRVSLDHRIRAGSLCTPCRTTLVEERGVSPTILQAVETVLEAGRAEMLGRRT